MSNWFAAAVGTAPSPRWAAVLDTSILVSAAIATHNNTSNVGVVRAAIAGLYACVLSEYIKEEVREVLQSDFGHAIGAIDAKFAPLWAVARMVTPVPFDDPQLAKVVHGDLDDLPILATGLAMYADPLLAQLPRKFIVSNDTGDFTPGQKPFGMHFLTGHQFWQHLQQGTKAKLP